MRGAQAAYDHVANHIQLLGCEPARFGFSGHAPDLNRYFAMARGVNLPGDHVHGADCGCASGPAGAGPHALEMTKWFDTNYHYLVPEFTAATQFHLASQRLFDEVAQARLAGHQVKAVLLGPLSFLWLGKEKQAGFDRLGLLDQLLPVYGQILARLKAQGVAWVQIDEPILGWTCPMPGAMPSSLPTGSWRTDADAALARLRPVADKHRGELWLAPSCSLLHVPYSLEAEDRLDPDVKSWLAFAVEKLSELRVLQAVLEGNEASVQAELADARAAVAARRRSPRVHRPEVAGRLALPLLPTTTIGSFPQTPEIRTARAAFRRGALDEAQYREKMRAEIAQAVRRQEAPGLDVLVHGEAERNDMVEYFGEQLDGFAFTASGWVQSYGSRCVKPPVIYGDVARPAPMTVAWTRYAQSLTAKPMKGMLTGPITLLQWSFVRDDQARSTTAEQIAWAIRDEAVDLEQAGIAIIQIDEPAIREGLPLRRAGWKPYLDWATRAFRISASGVADETQIHTHMCYSEFNDILPEIAALDADVITIETSRSDMELLRGFGEFKYPNEIGPGVYDIHSPRVPAVDEMVQLMRKAASVVPLHQLWVNPDCGLKTRGWPETQAALANMVQAAGLLRREAQAG